MLHCVENRSQIYRLMYINACNDLRFFNFIFSSNFIKKNLSLFLTIFRIIKRQYIRSIKQHYENF